MRMTFYWQKNNWAQALIKGVNIMLHRIMDIGRNALHRFAGVLGEGTDVKPSSIKKNREARKTVHLDLPAFRSLLPYESMDNEQLFINKTTSGFGLHVVPSPGADETLVKSMAELFKNKLPEGFDCTVLLYKHHYLAEDLERGFEPMLAKGGIYKTLAEMSIKYHVNAIKNGYKNNRNIPAQLADYAVYFFFSGKNIPDIKNLLILLRNDIESEINVAGLAFERLSAPDFLVLMRTLVSPNLDAVIKPRINPEKDMPLSYVIPEASTFIEIGNTTLDIESSDEEGNPAKTRLVCAHINQWPEKFALWQTPDLFGNILRPEHGIDCPFLISFTVRGVNKEAMRSLAKRRAKNLNSNANAIQHFLNPGAARERDEWNFAYLEIEKGNMDLVPTFYNLILFTTEKDERTHVARAIGAYRQMGFELTQSKINHWLRFLSSLPFFATEGLFSGITTLGMTKKISHYNAANLMPIVADFKGSRSGMLLPTHRHQLSYLDTFDDKHLPITNFNVLTVGSPGAGKSMFQQAQIFSGLARDEIIFVIDLGDSYKHLCELVGGTYLDVSKITLNPFTLFDFEGHSELGGEEVDNYIQIRDLLAIMASPHKEVCEVQKSFLLQATLTCWRKKGRKSCIDDVIDALRELLDAPESKDDPRLNDLIILLKPFARSGIYGHMCNGDTPLLNGSNFVVLEMGGLSSNKDLLTIMMFVMIVVIQGQFYQTDRRVRKRCYLDEAWRFLTEGSNPIAANFIEQGFRTARKYNGGFTVVTQYLADTEKTIQGQAIAASSDIKIIMRQGNFQQYLNHHPNTFSPLQAKMIESFGEAKGAGFSSLMVQYGNAYTFHRYFADPFTRVLFSSSGQEFADIEELCANGVSMEEAVTRVAETYYGDELCNP